MNRPQVVLCATVLATMTDISEEAYEAVAKDWFKRTVGYWTDDPERQAEMIRDARKTTDPLVDIAYAVIIEQAPTVRLQKREAIGVVYVSDDGERLHDDLMLKYRGPGTYALLRREDE